jgi:hypothetical protein
LCFEIKRLYNCEDPHFVFYALKVDSTCNDYLCEHTKPQQMRRHLFLSHCIVHTAALPVCGDYDFYVYLYFVMLRVLKPYRPFFFVNDDSCVSVFMTALRFGKLPQVLRFSHVAGLATDRLLTWYFLHTDTPFNKIFAHDSHVIPHKAAWSTYMSNNDAQFTMFYSLLFFYRDADPSFFANSNYFSNIQDGSEFA